MYLTRKAKKHPEKQAQKIKKAMQLTEKVHLLGGGGNKTREKKEMKREKAGEVVKTLYV